MSVSFTIKNEHILKNIQVINRHMDSILGRVIDPPLKKHFRSFMQTTSGMKRYPGAVARPIEWETPAQKRWARWALGRGILPSSRTKEMFRHFDVLSDKRVGEVAIVNTSDYAKYVIGDRQQKFHRNTGYRKLDSYQDELLDSSVPIAQKALDSEIRSFLFKRKLI
jgi:hypothetical protein